MWGLSVRVRSQFFFIMVACPALLRTLFPFFFSINFSSFNIEYPNPKHDIFLLRDTSLLVLRLRTDTILIFYNIPYIYIYT